METKADIKDNSLYENTSEVGIEWYMNENTPIKGAVIKHRYSDFIVNEIPLESKLWCRLSEIYCAIGDKIAMLARDEEIKESLDVNDEEDKGKIVITLIPILYIKLLYTYMIVW